MNTSKFLSLAMTAGLVIQFCIPLNAEASKVYRKAYSGRVSKQHESGWKKAAKVPVKAVGAIVGVGIGTPIRALKGMHHDAPRLASSVHRDMGGKNNGASKAAAAAVGGPMGATTGAVRGSLEGVGRGLKYGYKKPFSSQSMGLH